MPDEKIRPADLPPGHARDEARRKVKDQLEEQIEREEAQTGVSALDEAKFRHVDNEIARHVSRRQRGRGLDVQDSQPGFRYVRLTAANNYKSANAEAAIRELHDEAKEFGFVPVQGTDPEDERFRGNDNAAGTSLRGVGDTILYRIAEADYQAMLADFRRKQERQGFVEHDSVVYAQRRAYMGGGDLTRDPQLARRFGPSASQSVLMHEEFTEGQLRRGGLSPNAIAGIRAGTGRR